MLLRSSTRYNWNSVAFKSQGRSLLLLKTLSAIRPGASFAVMAVVLPKKGKIMHVKVGLGHFIGRLG